MSRRRERWCWSRGRCSPETETRTGASPSATGYYEVRTSGRREGDTSESPVNLTLPPPVPPGNEGNIFQIDEDTGNITMTKAADIAGPITLSVLVNSPPAPLRPVPRWEPEGSDLSRRRQASQVTNRDQFAVTQVTIEVMKRSRNPPRFEKDRYEGFIYSNSVPESMILRDRSTYRPFRVRARDEDFASVS